MLGLTAVSIRLGTVLDTSIQDPGPHGLSEVLYAFTSQGNNNGSAFAGYTADTPWMTTTGVIVGLLSSRVVRLSVRDEARRSELQHLLAFAHTATSQHDPSQLAAEACDHISAVLDLQDCRWHGGYHGGGGAVLLPDGSVMGYVTGLEPDRAVLPRDLELPARAGSVELGRFILIPRRGFVTSFEERRTAATIARLFASALAGRADAGTPT